MLCTAEEVLTLVLHHGPISVLAALLFQEGRKAHPRLLHIKAVDDEDLSAVSRLLEAGIPSKTALSISDTPSTALYHAIERRNPQIVSKLVAAGAIRGLQDSPIAADYLDALLVFDSAEHQDCSAANS